MDRTDQELLIDYSDGRSESAFAELVQRYLDLVYSVARRMTGDAHASEDVAQSTFLALAHNASKLKNRCILAGWLHRTARNIAVKTVRADVRRRAREQEVAATMNEHSLTSVPASTSIPTPFPQGNAWDEVRPLLDSALGAEGGRPRRDSAQILSTKNGSRNRTARRAHRGCRSETGQSRGRAPAQIVRQAPNSAFGRRIGRGHFRQCD